MYHHLAMLEQKPTLCQLYYIGRSFSSVELFNPARQSMREVFKSFLDPETKSPNPNLSPHDFGFIETHAFAFDRKSDLDYNTSSQSYLHQLDRPIRRKTAKWAEKGVCTAIVNISGWIDYGAEENYLRQQFHGRKKRRGDPMVDAAPILIDIEAYNEDPNFCRVRKLTGDMLALVLGRLAASATETYFRTSTSC